MVIFSDLLPLNDSDIPSLLHRSSGSCFSLTFPLLPPLSLSRLKHLPCSAMDFLPHIFNFSWSLHSFPFIWNPSFIVSIYKMGKLLDYPASFWPISPTSCVSKLFERIILSRPLFFLESNFILSPRQASFRPEQSTLDQIMFFSFHIEWV